MLIYSAEGILINICQIVKSGVSLVLIMEQSEEDREKNIYCRLKRQLLGLYHSKPCGLTFSNCLSDDGLSSL